MEPKKASLGSSNNGTLNHRALVFFPDYAVESKCPILGNEIMFIFCCVENFFSHTNFTICFWLKTCQYDIFSDIMFYISF